MCAVCGGGGITARGKGNAWIDGTVQTRLFDELIRYISSESILYRNASSQVDQQSKKHF